VKYREEKGLTSRAQLRKVPKLGPRAFEQCAGFLRFPDSREPLDATAVHPESYPAARELLRRTGFDAKDVRAGRLGGGAQTATSLRERAEAMGLSALADALKVGVPTLSDIMDALMKPGRDPRDELPPPLLRTDVLSLSDLKPGMHLKGTVRNLTDFGAFIDIGVHQDGLVHVSELSDRFVRDPSEVVKAGDKLKVRVLSVDKARRRIALSAKTQPSAARPAGARPAAGGREAGGGRPGPPRGGGLSSGRGSSGGGFSVNPFAGL